MWKSIKVSLLCICIGVALTAPAQAAQQHKKPHQKVALYVYNAYSQSFADLLNPGQSLGDDYSPLFGKTQPGVTWTINSVFLFLPYHGQQGHSGVYAFHGNGRGGGNAWDEFTANPVSIFALGNRFAPPVLLVLYEAQISAVPEASAGVMMALGLPVIGWLAWRRRSGNAQSNTAETLR